jgi:hypothetical protein
MTHARGREIGPKGAQAGARLDQIRDLVAAEPGLQTSEIAARFGVSAVKKLDLLRASGEVESCAPRNPGRGLGWRVTPFEERP